MRLFATAALAAVLAFAGGSARAASMDPAPERMVLQPPNMPAGQTCQSIAQDPEVAVKAGQLPNAFPCRPDNVAFRNMVSELGFAIAPNAFHPARTTGLGGVALTLEASFTKINSNALSRATDGTTTNYWQKGTEGTRDVNTKSSANFNLSPDSLIQIYSLKARKGLPYGLELTGSLGYVSNTTLWVGGADLRWSLLEGFRTGALGIVPDFSIGGGVRTLTGTSKFNLTTVGIDAQVSKPITLADSAVITPYLGYQRLIILGDSLIVDGTPNVDALQQCGYAGPDPQSGAPTCRHKLSNGADANADFNNNFTFEKVRTHRHRGIFGVSYRYEILFLASQFLIDLTPPDAENPGLNSTRQWTLSFEAGVYF
ncbi:MAG: hypothetical protein JWM74_1128 [Myxococcaceae bacterium]|jgi:hypothetical protein|nr:hypothetical protein [Myxococcaceae bacterium]